MFLLILLKQNQNANTSCDFYNRYVQDLISMDFMNIRNFRHSISWSRILPFGTGQINWQGDDFYDRLIDYCLELNIEPWLTLYHWDLPQALEDRGGWTNRDILYWFEEYIRICLDKFGDRVKNWMVLNEPTVFTGAGYFLGVHAPGKRGLKYFLPAVHHAALCQGIGIKVIQSYKGLKAGTTFSCSPVFPVSNQSFHIDAAKQVDVILNRLFIEPLLGLGYPTDDFKLLHQIEDYMQPGDSHLIHGVLDFIGLQNYTREFVSYSPFVPYLSANLIKAKKRKVPMTDMEWEIYPKGVYEMLHRFAQYPNVKNIIITEGGAAFKDEITNGEINDQDRINYISSYLDQVLLAKKDGVLVNGYFIWSFLDNFEWAEGYSKRFGLVYVDYNTGKRILKKSAHWYKEFLKVKSLSNTISTSNVSRY